MRSSDSELKRPRGTWNAQHGTGWREINGGTTQKRGHCPTLQEHPSQTGSMTPASAPLPGLGSRGRGAVGQHGNRPSPRAPTPRDPERRLGEHGHLCARPVPAAPEQYLGERSHPLRQLRLHLGQRLRPPQCLLQLLLRQLQALLQLPVSILCLQRESRAAASLRRP